jgi:hypothetical protein
MQFCMQLYPTADMYVVLHPLGRFAKVWGVFLCNLAWVLYRRAGVQLSRVELKFTDLNASADVLVGSRGMPTVANAFINTPLELLTAARLLPSNRHHHSILQGVSGVLRPGRLTLLLGPPGR